MIASREHEFSYGHRVAGHEGKCRHLHGHNGKVIFHIAADKLDHVGRVIDFSIIKSKLCMWLEKNWDHRFLIWEDDQLARKLKKIDSTVVLVPFNPTAENMAEYLVTVIGPKVLPRNVKLQKCTFFETSKCSATFEETW